MYWYSSVVMRDIFVNKGKKGKNIFQDQLIFENRLKNDPVYKAQFTRHGLGREGGYGFDVEAATEQYLYDLNSDPRNRAAIDYARRINEDEKFAETQGGKMRKLSKKYLEADKKGKKGGYGVSNLEQARYLDKLKYKFRKKHVDIGDDGGYNSANDADEIYDGMNSRLNDYDFSSRADELASQNSKKSERDEFKTDEYELSPELNSAIDRDQEFGERRYAGEIFAGALNEGDPKGYERENPFLFQYADGMRFNKKR